MDIASNQVRLTKAQQDLVTEHIQLAYYIAYKHFPSSYPISYEDRVSLASIGLCNAARMYNPEHLSKAKFSSYAVTAMINSVRMELRKVNRYSGFSTGMTVLSLDAPVRDQNGYQREKSILDNVVDQTAVVYTNVECEVLAALIETEMNTLPDKQRTCLQKHVSGKSQYDIATELGVSQSYVSRLLMKARATLQQRLEEIGVDV